MYDVAIVGAGPAGSTLARLLRTGLRVLLVDGRRLDLAPGAQGACKPCGGLLAPGAQRELALQGLGVPHLALAGPQVFAVRAMDTATGLERLYQRHYLNVDREVFDRWLASLPGGNVETLFGWRVHALQRGTQGTLLRLRRPAGGRASVVARLVVGADGGASFVRRAAFPGSPAPRRYVGIQGVFSGTGHEPHFGAVFVPGLTDLYAWTIPKDGATIVGIAVPTGAGAVAAYERFVALLERRGVRLGRQMRREAAVVVRPRGLRDMLLGDTSVILVGEAAGFVSPSSAEGIGYALRSARVLAGSIAEGASDPAASYRRAIAPLALELAAKSLKSSLIHGRVSRELLMSCAVGAIAGGPPRGSAVLGGR